MYYVCVCVCVCIAEFESRYGRETGIGCEDYDEYKRLLRESEEKIDESEEEGKEEEGKEGKEEESEQQQPTFSLNHLLEAAQQGILDRVSYILDQGVRVNEEDSVSRRKRYV